MGLQLLAERLGSGTGELEVDDTTDAIQAIACIRFVRVVDG